MKWCHLHFARVLIIIAIELIDTIEAEIIWWHFQYIASLNVTIWQARLLYDARLLYVAHFRCLKWETMEPEVNLIRIRKFMEQLMLNLNQLIILNGFESDTRECCSSFKKYCIFKGQYIWSKLTNIFFYHSKISHLILLLLFIAGWSENVKLPGTSKILTIKQNARMSIQYLSYQSKAWYK